VLTRAGIQADVRVVPPESFGAALQYFTGSKQHNIKLRDLAVRHHLKLNEYGVFRVVELSDIKGDLQMHSTWSDGHHTIAEMARAAKALGYRYIAVTDHSPSQTIANGLSIERLRKRRQELESARKEVRGIAILDGAEVDIKRDGSLDYPDEVLAELDFVVASVHSGWKMSEEAMTERLVKAMENPWVDCIGHPTGRLIGQREPYAVDMEKVLKAAARLGVAMEINAYPDRLDLKDTHARRAGELGVKILINTDSHAADQLQYMHFGVSTARRGWLEAGEVLNTLPLADLRRALRRARRRGGGR